MLFTASDLASITSHTHNWVFFLLWLCLFILSGIMSPLISSSILGTYWLGCSSVSVLSFWFFILFMRFSKWDYWSGLPFRSSVDHILSEISTMSHPSWVALHGLAYFIEFDKLKSKSSLSLWFDWLVLCDCGFSLSALWCPLSVPTVLLGFLLPWTWGISSWLLKQSIVASAHCGAGAASGGWKTILTCKW